MTTEKGSDLVKHPSIWWILWQAWRNLNARKLVAQEVDLTGKKVVMTGANSGLGWEAALYFARCGANMLLVCREEVPSHELKPDEAVEELRATARDRGHLDSQIDWSPCDLTKLTNVGEFAKRYLATGETIDLLILNAGMKTPQWGTKFTTDDGFELIHQVNFISQVLLCMLLLPALAKASTPRIICTTSGAHFFGRFNLENSNQAIGSYVNNKLYFQTWITEFQSRLLKFDEYKHITIQGVHPGFVQTGLLNKREEGERKIGILKLILMKLVHYFGCITPQQGSIALTNAATSAKYGPNQEVQGIGAINGGGGGKYLNRIWEGTPMPQTKDTRCRQIVWDFVAEELMLSERGLLKGLGD